MDASLFYKHIAPLERKTNLLHRWGFERCEVGASNRGYKLLLLFEDQHFAGSRIIPGG